MNKKSLSETDIRTKFITPSVVAAGWDLQTQIREEVGFTAGRVIVRGKVHTRGERKQADYVLYYKPNMPIAVIEAKDNTHTVKSGIQQSLGYAEALDVPFVFSSNGDGFFFHDRTITSGAIESEIALDAFPSPDELWEKYKAYKGITDEIEPVISQKYHTDQSSRTPRYYQQIAINRTVEAVAKEESPGRHLLVMATGTGKTYTAFQVIYRLWKSGVKKRILFLADRNALIDQTVRGDFRHFKDAMTVIKHKKIDHAYSVYLALYQGLSDTKEGGRDAYKEFSPDFFDLVVIDECHRGSVREDSKWREILEYFSGATHIGLTATPKETKEVSNIEYFGDPLYTYSLRQGIDDGFLAPYKVVKVTIRHNGGAEKGMPQRQLMHTHAQRNGYNHLPSGVIQRVAAAVVEAKCRRLNVQAPETLASKYGLWQLSHLEKFDAVLVAASEFKGRKLPEVLKDIKSRGLQSEEALKVIRDASTGFGQRAGSKFTSVARLRIAIAAATKAFEAVKQDVALTATDRLKVVAEYERVLRAGNTAVSAIKVGGVQC